MGRSAKRVAVIGGGASGLVAACFAADAGAQVALFEKPPDALAILQPQGIDDDLVLDIEDLDEAEVLAIAVQVELGLHIDGNDLPAALVQCIEVPVDLLVVFQLDDIHGTLLYLN